MPRCGYNFWKSLMAHVTFQKCSGQPVMLWSCTLRAQEILCCAVVLTLMGIGFNFSGPKTGPSWIY